VIVPKRWEYRVSLGKYRLSNHGQVYTPFSLEKVFKARTLRKAAVEVPGGIRNEPRGYAPSMVIIRAYFCHILFVAFPRVTIECLQLAHWCESDAKRGRPPVRRNGKGSCSEDLHRLQPSSFNRGHVLSIDADLDL
jgi:hypothetical protein